jgi:hypothetical protein
LLFHARDAPTEVVADSPEARRKGWRRIVLLFNFFIPGAVQADANPNPIAITLTTHHSTFTLALALALTLTLTLCRRTLALAP